MFIQLSKVYSRKWAHIVSKFQSVAAQTFWGPLGEFGFGALETEISGGQEVLPEKGLVATPFRLAKSAIKML